MLAKNKIIIIIIIIISRSTTMGSPNDNFERCLELRCGWFALSSGTASHDSTVTSAQQAPKSHLARLTSRPRAPKTAQEGAMDGSRRPKSRPGPTQGAPRRSKNQQKRCTVVVFSGFGRTRPESHRVRTRRRPRAPQGAPGAAQEPPKSHPDGPRAAKSRPGRRQGPPGGPQEA